MYAKTARVRTSRSWLLFASLVAPFAVVWIPSPAWLVFGCMFGALIGPIVAWFALPKTRRGIVSADQNGLRLGDRLIARRATAHSAFVRASRGASWVRMSTPRGFVDVEIENASDEAALLAALRLDERGVVTRFTVTPDRFRSRACVSRFLFGVPVPLLLLMGALAVIWQSRWPWGLVGLAAMIVTLVVQLRATLRMFETVSIGSDGIRRRSPIGRARFTPFSHVQSVMIDRGDLVVHLAGGGELAWHGRWNRPGAILAAMAMRIQRGLQAHRALEASRAASQLARGSRSVERWIREVRVATDPESGSYRVAAIPPEELWETVESAVAPPTARAGAAVALHRVLDDAGRKRLLDASASCASSTLRRALESVASDEPIEPRLALLRD
ncbi:MAG TPA: hypothetical protein VGH28_18130 [Polyangiaceae bacterium]|jgi:hypothetical protein